MTTEAASKFPSRKAAKIDRLAELTAELGAREAGRSLWREALSRLRRSPMAIVGGSVILIFVVLAVIGPFIAPHAAEAQIWRGEVRIASGEFVGPRSGNLLGLDHLGRDIFSRILVGARHSLLVGVVATGLGFTCGALLGGLSGAALSKGGKLGARIDAVLMRVTDVMLALPALLLAISVAAVLGQSLTTVMIAVGVIQIPIFARLLRGSMLAQSQSDYVLAGRALGLKHRRIVLGHVVPNSLGPIIVQATLSLATAIIEAAALSFLGLGNPDSSTPEWGLMLSQAQVYFDAAPMMSLYPALAIILTALGFTLLGEAIRESLDPKLRK